VGNSISYARPWLPIFDHTKDQNEAEACLFTGGSDIQPELYGEDNRHRLSSPFPNRDQIEVAAFHHFKERKIPMIGICRGAQLITALTGGKLFQHVSGHVGDHLVTTDDGQNYMMTSLHHQMMRPNPEKEYRIIAWSVHRSNIYATGADPVNRRPDLTIGDPEIIWYPEVKALCIQGHPEFMDTHDPANEYMRDLASQLMFA
jgi:gamma-glutamyl-gamma-aminobutyrate hydrolase PuuD